MPKKPLIWLRLLTPHSQKYQQLQRTEELHLWTPYGQTNRLAGISTEQSLHLQMRKGTRLLCNHLITTGPRMSWSDLDEVFQNSEEENDSGNCMPSYLVLSLHRIPFKTCWDWEEIHLYIPFNQMYCISKTWKIPHERSGISNQNLILLQFKDFLHFWKIFIRNKRFLKEISEILFFVVFTLQWNFGYTRGVFFVFFGVRDSRADIL